MSTKAIVLDANILIRAVLGKRVRELILENTARAKFFSPAVAYADARKYLPALLDKRGVQGGAAIAVSIAWKLSFRSSMRRAMRACGNRRCSAFP